MMEMAAVSQSALQQTYSAAARLVLCTHSKPAYVGKPTHALGELQIDQFHIDLLAAAHTNKPVAFDFARVGIGIAGRGDLAAVFAASETTALLFHTNW